ncbi:MAG TPA: thioredoxin family protein [Candidatus Brocadiia bacterium]|nr:thioredoxin family protein [Candidatus Brocadiia bacterium]
MRGRIVPVLAASALVAFCCAFSADAAEGKTKGGSSVWLTSYDKAVEAAKESGKPILADFTGSDWCGWCIKLKAEVFDTKEFKQWAGENVILLELDFPKKKAQSADTKKQNQELAAKYGIRGYPTILFLDADGKALGKSGYMKGGAKAWIENARKIIDARADAPAAAKQPELPTLEKVEKDAKGQKVEKGEKKAKADGAEWLTSLDEAMNASKKTKKPILADFTGSDWCGWCIKLKAEVFDTPEFKQWAAENVVLLEIDFPRKKAQDEETKKQNQELATKYGIRGYPTILFLDTEGNVLGKSGYMKGGPTGWIENAQKAIASKEGGGKARQ